VKQYGVYNTFRDRLAAPSTFIIDKQGVIRWKYLGKNRYTDRPSVKQVIEQLQTIEG